MSDMKFTTLSMFQSRKVRYLIVGGANTLIGYSLGVGLYYVLSPTLHILLIGAISSVLAISVSFTTYKLFVFRTRGHWLTEYLRSYVIYGGMALLGIILLWVLVDSMQLPIWLAQGVSILITVVISYVGHARFTFRLTSDSEVRGIK